MMNKIICKIARNIAAQSSYKDQFKGVQEYLEYNYKKPYCQIFITADFNELHDNKKSNISIIDDDILVLNKIKEAYSFILKQLSKLEDFENILASDIIFHNGIYQITIQAFYSDEYIDAIMKDYFNNTKNEETNEVNKEQLNKSEQRYDDKIRDIITQMNVFENYGIKVS